MVCPGSLSPLGRAVMKPVMGVGWAASGPGCPGEEDVRELGGPWPHLACSPTTQRHSLVRDKCFLSATECLQKMM